MEENALLRKPSIDVLTGSPAINIMCVGGEGVSVRGWPSHIHGLKSWIGSPISQSFFIIVLK